MKQIYLLCMIFIAMPTFANINDYLRAHWTFNNNLNDRSGYGHHLSSEADPLFAAGRFDQALKLDGTAERVLRTALTSQLNFTESFTLSLWIRPETTSGPARLLDHRGQGSSKVWPGWQFRIKPANVG